MRSIYIEFTSPSTWKIISAGIMAFQRTKFSHVRLRWETDSGQSLVYEASGTEVKFLGPAGQKIHPVKIIESYRLDLSDSEFKSMLGVCISFAGIKYGKLQILGILVSSIFGLSYNVFSDNNKTMVCSELASRVLEALGFKISKDVDKVGPKEVSEFLKTLKQAVRVV